jgi:E3 ubiquitin-protein ligase RNF144
MLSGSIPVFITTSISSPNDLLTSIFSSPDSLEIRTLLVCSVAVLVLMPILGSVFWSIYSKKKKTSHGTSTIQPVIVDSPQSPAQVAKPYSLSDAFLNETLDDSDTLFEESVSDSKYAEDLQVQEALLASLLTSETLNNASSSITHPNSLQSISNQFDEQTEILCEICLENKPTWQMFDIPTCSHTFCYNCTSQHVASKIQENLKIIKCPGLNCKNILDSNVCRSIVPEEVLVKWDESLCKSLILESQKMYCPFNDCSVMLVNDSNEIITEIKCPLCKRFFCAACKVPWHSDFTCKEFEKMNAKKKGREEVMVKNLAKKKNWRKCPSCKFYVEKAEGCLHITCRCQYQFCYRCGSKWKSNHGGCRPRS